MEKENISVELDNYLMDVEIEALHHWDHNTHGLPTGIDRYKNKKWRKHVYKYSCGSRDYKEFRELYIQWVKNGGGDDLFINE